MISKILEQILNDANEYDHEKHFSIINLSKLITLILNPDFIYTIKMIWEFIIQKNNIEKNRSKLL